MSIDDCRRLNLLVVKYGIALFIEISKCQIWDLILRIFRVSMLLHYAKEGYIDYIGASSSTVPTNLCQTLSTVLLPYLIWWRVFINQIMAVCVKKKILM